MTLRQLAKRLDGLANSTEELCEVLANRSLKLIQEGFRNEVDPRGVAWAPRRSGQRKFTAASVNAGGAFKQGKARQGHKLLHQSGDLQGGFTVIGVNRNGFTVGSWPEYGGFHQTGTKFLPARRMVPKSGEGLGTWAEPLQEVAKAFIRRKLGVK